MCFSRQIIAGKLFSGKLLQANYCRQVSAGIAALLHTRPAYKVENPFEGTHSLEWDSTGNFLAVCSSLGRLR